MVNELPLMLWTQQVVDGLHRVEGGERHFHKDCVPVAHGAIPKTWKFESLEFFSVLALVGYKASVLIDKLGEVELLALVILHGADEVNGIEVGAVVEHVEVFGVVLSIWLLSRI